VAPISIRFERFTVFHTSGSAGGHDFNARIISILSPDLKIESVMAKGRLLIHQNQLLVKGTFEN
jgi:hypothetical protein